MSNSKQVFNKSNVPTSLYGMLALRTHRINCALGITRITPQVSLLLYHYNRLKQAEYLAEIEAMTPLDRMRLEFDQAKARLVEVVELANQATDPSAKQIYTDEAMGLDRSIRQFVQQLEKVAND